MLAKALRLLRTINDLSQADLAKELGISAAYLCQIEAGNRKVSTELLQRYSDWFKIPVSTLWVFSETLNDNSLKERSRVYAADKLLRIMDAIAGEDLSPKHVDDEVLSH